MAGRNADVAFGCRGYAVAFPCQFALVFELRVRVKSAALAGTSSRIKNRRNCFSAAPSSYCSQQTRSDDGVSMRFPNSAHQTLPDTRTVWSQVCVSVQTLSTVLRHSDARGTRPPPGRAHARCPRGGRFLSPHRGFQQMGTSSQTSFRSGEAGSACQRAAIAHLSPVTALLEADKQGSRPSQLPRAGWSPSTTTWEQKMRPKKTKEY